MQGLPSDIWTDETLIGKYRFEEQLAASAMAVVVAARHLELDERVAIKFLSPDAMHSSAAVARFRSEARAAARIKNQHVVRIIDVATTTVGIPYIVMEYLDGKDLERVLAQYDQRRAPIPDAIDFILQASEALIEGHRLGIVHRDLKPANLFCIDRGDGYPLIKVLDFGISKISAKIGEVDRTDQHEILGSPRYMSPEQIDSSRNVDQRTDIWSLGVILYEAIAGQAPFAGDIIPELWSTIRHETPVLLSKLRQDCPTTLVDIVGKCLEKEREKRYADLAALALALAPMAPERSRGSIARIQWTAEFTDVSTRPSAFSVSGEISSTERARRRHWVLAGVIASALTLGFGWFATRILANRQARTAPQSEGRTKQQSVASRLLESSVSAHNDRDQAAPRIEPVVLPDTQSDASSTAQKSPATQRANVAITVTRRKAALEDALLPAATAHSEQTKGFEQGTGAPAPLPWLVQPVEKRK